MQYLDINVMQYLNTFFSLVPPVIMASPVSTTELLSPARLTLSCSADSLPLPIIAWLRTFDDRSETIFNTSSVLERGRNIFVMNSFLTAVNAMSMLSVDSTTAIDSGNYTCIATNRLGSSVSENFDVAVYGKSILDKVNSHPLWLTIIFEFEDVEKTDMLMFPHCFNPW